MRANERTGNQRETPAIICQLSHPASTTDYNPLPPTAHHCFCDHLYELGWGTRVPVGREGGRGYREGCRDRGGRGGDIDQ